MSGDTDWIKIDDGGFLELVGPFFHRPSKDGGGYFRFEAQPKHANRSGIVHGGMLMTFADRSLGFTARRGDARRHATVQLDVHFVRPVQIGETVEMECRVVRETRSLVFVDGTISVNGEIAATASGIWKFIA